jgi:hypothetical protein
MDNEVEALAKEMCMYWMLQEGMELVPENKDNEKYMNAFKEYIGHLWDTDTSQQGERNRKDFRKLAELARDFFNKPKGTIQ